MNADGRIILDVGRITLDVGRFTLVDGRITPDVGRFTLVDGRITPDVGRFTLVNGRITLDVGRKRSPSDGLSPMLDKLHLMSDDYARRRTMLDVGQITPFVKQNKKLPITSFRQLFLHIRHSGIFGSNDIA